VSAAAPVGVLALQGGFREHREALVRAGVETIDVRLPGDLDRVRALVLPGGESTAISHLLETSGLLVAVARRLDDGDLPLLGTCAGAILSAREVLDGVAEQRSFGAFDAVVRRNGIGRQVASFEAPLDVDGLDGPFLGVFIRPPVVESVGAGVDVLASRDGRPVLCRQGAHLFAVFHPELTGDDRIHQMWLAGFDGP